MRTITARKRIRSSPSTKLGNGRACEAGKLISQSSGVLRRAAASTPSGIASATEISSETAPSSAVTGSRCMIACVTGCDNWMDCPRLP